MSYILDALKKSEREKTLGQVPTLETIVADGAKKQPAGTPWWLNILVFVFVLLAILVGLYFAGLINLNSSSNSVTTTPPVVNEQATHQTAQQNEGASVEIAAVDQPEQNQQPVQQTAVANEIEQAEIVTSQTDSVDPGQQQQSLSNATQAVIEPTIEQTINEEQERELSEIVQAQQEDLAQQQAEELIAIQQAQLLEQQAAQEPVEELPEPQQLELNQQVAATTSASQDYEEALHQSLRNVAVNVVSYSSDARQRFVMLDLTIYKEGDSLPMGADVIEIMRTGAIVEYQNKRYLLKP